MKKRIFASFLALACMATLVVGCGSKEAEETQAEATEQVVEEATEKPAEAAEADAVDAMIAEVEVTLQNQLGVEPESGKGERIGVLIITTTNEFWNNMKNRYEEAAADLGIEVEVFEAAAEDDTQGQLDALNTMLTMDFDAIIVSPINGTNLIPGIVAANEAGIPIINLGPGVDLEALEAAGGHLDGKITVNFEEQGQTVANDMISRLPEGGEVAILGGLEGAGQSVGRTNGAKSVFEATDGIDLVAVQACDWDTEKAYEATKDILTAHPELKGIFACNDNMALAAVQALQEMGNEDVLVYGVDYTSDAKAAIEEGTMMGSMTYSSVAYTRAAEKMAMILAQGGSFEGPVYLPLTLINQDNVAELEGWR